VLLSHVAKYRSLMPSLALIGHLICYVLLPLARQARAGAVTAYTLDHGTRYTAQIIVSG
jgi:hypothetical protein